MTMTESKMSRRRTPKGAVAVCVLAALAWMSAPPARAQAVEFHRGNGIAWTIHDLAIYNRHKAEFDLFTRNMAPVTGTLGDWFGKHMPNPIRFHFRSGGCGVGTELGTVTVGDSCVVGKPATRDAQAWPRQTSYFFLGYAVFLPHVSGLPYEDFRDPVFKVMQAELAGLQDGAQALARIEGEVDTEVKRRKYQYYKGLRQQYGYTLFRGFFESLKADALDLTQVGTDPSPVRSSYVQAYLSLACMNKLGRQAGDAGIPGVTAASVMEVLRARNLLLIADRKGQATGPAWTAYRSGRPQDVKGLLPR